MECYRTLLLLTLAIFCGFTSCEVIKAQKCYIPGGAQPNCVVHEVKIDPCPEAADNKPCKIKLGNNATLTFEYTPTWGATKAGSQAFKVGGLLDAPFEQMNTNGCGYTTCPIEANKRQTYVFTLEVAKQFPVGVHPCKLKLWNEDDHHQQCCFKFGVQLVN